MSNQDIIISATAIYPSVRCEYDKVVYQQHCINVSIKACILDDYVKFFEPEVHISDVGSTKTYTNGPVALNTFSLPVSDCRPVLVQMLARNVRNLFFNDPLLNEASYSSDIYATYMVEEINKVLLLWALKRKSEPIPDCPHVSNAGEFARLAKEHCDNDGMVWVSDSGESRNLSLSIESRIIDANSKEQLARKVRDFSLPIYEVWFDIEKKDEGR